MPNVRRDQPTLPQPWSLADLSFREMAETFVRWSDALQNTRIDTRGGRHVRDMQTIKAGVASGIRGRLT